MWNEISLLPLSCKPIEAMAHILESYFDFRDLKYRGLALDAPTESSICPKKHCRFGNTYQKSYIK